MPTVFVVFTVEPLPRYSTVVGICSEDGDINDITASYWVKPIPSTLPAGSWHNIAGRSLSKSLNTAKIFNRSFLWPVSILPTLEALTQPHCHS